MEEQGKEVFLGKDTSTKVTKETKFGTTIGQLRAYNKDLTPIDWERYPKITVTAAEDLDKFQYGIIKINIKNWRDDDLGLCGDDYYIQIDGLMSVIYNVYAKTLNDLRRATIRQKTVKMYGILKMFVYKVRRLFSK